MAELVLLNSVALLFQFAARFCWNRDDDPRIRNGSRKTDPTWLVNDQHNPRNECIIRAKIINYSSTLKLSSNTYIYIYIYQYLYLSIYHLLSIWMWNYGLFSNSKWILYLYLLFCFLIATMTVWRWNHSFLWIIMKLKPMLFNIGYGNDDFNYELKHWFLINWVRKNTNIFVWWEYVMR